MKMGSPTKGFAILFLAAFAVFTTTVAEESRKPQIGSPVPINVPYVARVAVPIQFQSQDYQGPYDPADPKGIAAANRRYMKIQNDKTAETVKSYIPPGIDKVAKKEFIHLALTEGRRFAVSHPKEAAEIVGIASKVKSLIHDAERKLEKEKEHDKKHGSH